MLTVCTLLNCPFIPSVDDLALLFNIPVQSTVYPILAREFVLIEVGRRGNFVIAATPYGGAHNDIATRCVNEEDDVVPMKQASQAGHRRR